MFHSLAELRQFVLSVIGTLLLYETKAIIVTYHSRRSIISTTSISLHISVVNYDCPYIYDLDKKTIH